MGNGRNRLQDRILLMLHRAGDAVFVTDRQALGLTE
jgi:hypothetical protein